MLLGIVEQSWGWWVGFNGFVLAMLAVDLGVFHRRAHLVRMKEALISSIIWILAALAFNFGLWQGWFGQYEPAERGRVALEFLTGYLIEKSLSVDNLFVFAVIFGYFAVRPEHQHRVLFYGILGALVFRAVFIFGGLWLLEKFAWMTYVFGGFLIVTGIKLALGSDRHVEPERNPVLRLLRAVLPISAQYDGGRFFTRAHGRLLGTPLLLVLAFVEMTDVVFAADSIPAVIAITHDPFIVYTSNVFAILGLRALYFVLAAFIRAFRYLSYGLAVLLVFVGGKMLVAAATGRHLPIGVSLAVIALILTVAVVASLLRPAKPAPPAMAESTQPE